MIISSVRLRNIKSFVEEELSFVRGINIIAGRNGAGKSTVIEAVGLALFDAWPQKFKDGNARSGFLRYGENEGSITVDVVHGSQRFTVQCDLGRRKKSGRESIDYERRLLRDGEEIAASAGRKREFQEDIREHILGAARIDDERLFRDIIGTEQGGFDDPFTRPEGDRRALFEKILGIEDFQDFDKQFWSLVKMQHSEAEKLSIRVEENAQLPREVDTARTQLIEREEELTLAATMLKEVSAAVTAAKKTAEKLSAQRDALAKAQAEEGRLSEKLRAVENAQQKAAELVEEARKAAAAVLKSLPGYKTFVDAESEIGKLRSVAKKRDEAKDRLALLRERYEKQKTRLQTQREGAERQCGELRNQIAEEEQDLNRRDVDIARLREEYQVLTERKKTLDAEAAFAEEVRSYVQDLNTVQQTLDNVDESMRGLRDTFAGIRERRERVALPLDFFPDLAAESERLFDRFIAAEGEQPAETPFAPLFEEARAAAEQARGNAEQSADARSRKGEEGKSARRQRDEKEKQIGKLRETLAAREKDIAKATEELTALDEAWEKESAKLSAVLEQHADLDERIMKLETLLEQHRAAHAEYLSQKTAAETLEQREQAATEAKDAVKETRTALKSAEKERKKHEEKFSEEEYTSVKKTLEAAQEQEKSASSVHASRKSLVDEQKTVLKKLEAKLREFERLRAQAAHARTEADFMREVHQGVVRELARHVGASIVSALSAFAAELYRRIAPEQELTLHWDAQSYAVELRGEQGTVRGRELSGGQLMGVSLAVKLALIKWYSQCRVGFLDEPTTHLDRETRHHLADVIQHLEQLTADGDPWFDQLFVISHEESFTGAGHLVELERDAEAGSRVMIGME
ncbi:MAG: SMC family ATPase [Bacteroidetes bacterium]|nr:SMC family ATPase [Bacteroidota bacterium]